LTAEQIADLDSRMTARIEKTKSEDNSTSSTNAAGNEKVTNIKRVKSA
jgi:hypothetical protein